MGSMKEKKAWDVDDVTWSKESLSRCFRALIVVNGHFTDSFTIRPPRSGRDSVFLRVWIPEGREEEFENLCKAKLRKPPVVSVC